MCLRVGHLQLVPQRSRLGGRADGAGRVQRIVLQPRKVAERVGDVRVAADKGSRYSRYSCYVRIRVAVPAVTCGQGLPLRAVTVDKGCRCSRYLRRS
jgi:hypothetical protein